MISPKLAEAAAPPRPGPFKRLDAMILTLNRWMLMAGLAAMAILIFSAVVLRYTVHASIPWSEEAARYLMVWITFIGLGPVLRIGGHISIDSLENSLPKNLARLLRSIVMLIVAAFFLFLIYEGAQYAMRTAAQSTPVTNVSFAWVSASIPVGFALSLWHLGAIAHRYVLEREFDASSDMDAAEVGAL